MFGAKALAATLAGLTLVPFGNLSEKLEERNPWQGYQSEDAYGLIVRAQHLSSGDGGKTCRRWAQALVSDEMGHDHGALPITDWPENFFKDWSPWSDREEKMVRNCTSIPCDVKMDRIEGKKLEQAPRDQKLEAFRDIVSQRIDRYKEAGERHEYEFPGALIDPWSFLEKRGFKTDLTRPGNPRLWIRRFVPEGDDSIRIRQVVDRRTALSPDGNEAVVWMRDVYTDHFFDGWGEWLQVKCSKDGSGTFVQALLLEVDLLKKNDLVSKLARGKIRSGVESRGSAYQNAEREHLLKVIHQNK